MGFKGDLTTISLADLFQTISLSQKEGTLIVQDGESEKKIFFSANGISLLSIGKRKGLPIGEILLRSKMITDDQLKEALNQQSSNKETKIGEILIEKGFINEEVLNKTLTNQVEEEIYDLFSWKNAEFEFNEGPMPEELVTSKALTELTFDVNSLLLEAARRVDEWELFLQVVPDENVIFGFNEGDIPVLPEDDDHPSLNTIVAQIDGENSVKDVIKITGCNRFEVYKTIYDLFQNGILKIEGAKEGDEDEYEDDFLDFTDSSDGFGDAGEKAEETRSRRRSTKVKKRDDLPPGIREEVNALMDEAKTIPPDDLKKLKIVYGKIIELDPKKINIKLLSEKVNRQIKRKKKKLVLKILLGVFFLCVLGVVGFGLKIELKARKEYRTISMKVDDLIQGNRYETALDNLKKFVKTHPYVIVNKKAESKIEQVRGLITKRDAQITADEKKMRERLWSKFKAIKKKEGSMSLPNVLADYKEFKNYIVNKNVIDLLHETEDRINTISKYLNEAKALYEKAYKYDNNKEYDKALAIYHDILNKYQRAPLIDKIKLPLYITSSPNGVSVFVNSKKQGYTPCIIRVEPYKHIKLEFEKKSYQTISTELGNIKQASMQVDLKKIALWTQRTSAPIVTQPTRIGGNICITSRDGAIYFLDPEVGAIYWSMRTQSEQDIESSPIVFNNMIYFGCNDGNVYALDSLDRKYKWIFKTNGFVKASPAINKSGTLIIVGSYDKNVYCIDALTGIKKWATKLDGSIVGQALIDNTKCYIGTTKGTLYSLDIYSGTETVIRKFDNGIFSAPQLFRNKLLLLTSAGYLYYINPDDGYVIWNVKAKNEVTAGVSISNGIAYFGDAGGTLYAVDLNTQRLKWNFNARGVISSTPSSSKEYVCFGTESGIIYCLNKKSGGLEWSYKASGKIKSSPFIYKNYMYIGSDDFNAYAFDIRY